MIGHIIGGALLVLAAAGTAYQLACAVVFRRFFARASTVATPRQEGVTILKPLHGDEPNLIVNLASFLDQDHAGPVQLLCGVQRPDDPAIAAVEALRTHHPEARIDLVIDQRQHGANGKIGNLINMAPHIAHGVVVLSDSDMVVGRDYLARLLAALDLPGVGAVTCLYRGRGDGGAAARFGAAGLSYQFLPGVVFAVALGLAQPCMGSTIALTRETLDRIGGFAPFADTLADDHAIGQAVRALGLDVAVPAMVVTHASAERTLAELWRHELRWGATVRDIAGAGYIGSVVTNPVPLALIGLVLTGGIIPLAVLIAALASRCLVAAMVDAQAGTRTASWWWLPLRDLFGLAVFLASLRVRRVDWRGSRLTMGASGRIATDMETE